MSVPLSEMLSKLTNPQAPLPQYGGNLPSGTQMVQGNLEAALDPRSRLIQDARRRGTQFAQQRGGINSSIAAGAAEREAFDTAERQAQQATQIDVNRQNTNAENWMAQQNFSRALMGQLTTIPLQSSLDMLSAVQAYGLQDPELYTPDVISGYSNFFQKNMNDILKNILKVG